MDLNDLPRLLTEAVAHYEKTAPTVSEWADGLFMRLNGNADNVRLSEVMAVGFLAQDGWLPPALAANRVYKLMHRLGQDTTGHENDRLRSLIADLFDADPCQFDHHGNCQAHGWFGEAKCPHARAKEVLS